MTRSLHDAAVDHDAARLVWGPGGAPLRDEGVGPVVLVLHGGGGTRTVAPLSDAFASRARVLTPTHPGFDGTAALPTLDSVRALARAYVDLLDQLDVADVVVVGSSIGGWIAAEMALADPTRLAGLVLLDAVGVTVPGEAVANVFSLTPAELGQLSWHDPAAMLRRMPPPSPEQQARQASNFAALAAYDGGLDMQDPTLRARLAQVTVPVLVAWGESDGVARAGYGRAYAEAFPNGRFELIPEAGHLPQLEQPAAVVALIERFLTRDALRPDHPERAAARALVPYTVDRTTAPALWLVGALWLPMATGPQTGNRFLLMEQLMPAGLGPPTHRHRRANEGFYILEGVCVFNADGETYEAGPGTFVYIPRMTPHSFSVVSEESRVLNFYAPSGFELLVMSLGQLAPERRRPTMAESAPRGVDQVRMLSRLFGDQEAVTALPFAEPSTPALMATEGGEPAARRVHLVASDAVSPTRDGSGAEWRDLAHARDTEGTYALSEVEVAGGAALSLPPSGQDRAFYVLTGALAPPLGTEWLAAQPGSFTFVPVGTAGPWMAGAEGARLVLFHIAGNG